MPAQASRDGDDLIIVHFVGDFFEPHKWAKAVPGGRRVRGQWAWRYPLAVDTCRAMREAWGENLRVERALGDWYREALVAYREQTERASTTEANLAILPTQYPKLNEWLKPDQRVGAEWIANAYRNGGLLADEGGVGKTATIVAGLLERNVQGNILVICPKVSVRSVWGKHFADLSDIPCYLARGTRAQREKVLAAFAADTGPRKALVVVAEMLRVKGTKEGGRRTITGVEYPELFDLHWSTIVVDEGHKLLGSLDVKNANLAGEGLCRLRYDDDTFRLCATATPWGKGGRVEALFGTLHWLWPDEYPSKWAWLNRFFDVSKEKVFVRGGRGATKDVTKVGGLKEGTDEKALYRSLGPRVLRRTMVEVSPQHAGLKNWLRVPCEMERPQERQYETFVENAELPVDGGILSSTGTLDYFTRCRQMANGVVRLDEGGKLKFTGESNKIDKLMAHLDHVGVLDGSSRTKVVIASQYNEFLDVIKPRLDKVKCAYLELRGSTSDTKREQAMDQFQGFGGPQVFIMNSKAGGVSITLDAADEMHVLDQMYPPEANEQLFWRIFRRGRVHEVFYYLYESEGTIDEKVSVAVAEGTEQQLRLLDGRRGLDTVRKLAAYEPPESL